MSKIEKIKRQITIILDHGSKGNRLASSFDIFIEILVLINVVAVIIESFENIYARYQLQLDIFEIFTVTIFSIEFFLRVWIADTKYPEKSPWQSRRKYLLSPNAIIDFLAILPFFVPYLLKADLRHLRVFRLIRLMRVFKLTKYSQSMMLIRRTVIEKKQELLATLLLMFSVLVVASSLIFYIEREVQPDVFPNILYAFWWGVITLTTVGYGDTYPITGLGKTIGGLVAIMGVLIVAIPTGIISSSFVQKMEESKYLKRMKEIRNRLKEAFYKKYIPELDCKVRRGQLSVDAVKVNLELSENDVYKIAEGKNEFRFRYKKVIQNGILTDKLYLEYREITATYGTFTNRNHKLTVVSPESLMKQGIGYFVYCLSEKLRCNYISNEFFGDESTANEESFGDMGLEPDTAFCFRHNKAYMQNTEGNIPGDFEEWKLDLIAAKQQNSIYLIFNTFEPNQHKNAFIHLTYLKKKTTKGEEYSFDNLNNIEAFKTALIQKAEEKFERKLQISENGNFQGVRENNIIQYIHETVGTNVLLINISEDYIVNEKLFSTAAIMVDAIKEELIGF